jgi:hypothetical protein
MSDLANTLFLLRLVKLVLEIALLALVGQGVMWALIRAVGQDPANNFFYRMLQVVVSPFTRIVRLITPKFVADRHVPWAVLGLLVVGYVWTLFAIANACIGHGLPIAECRRVR